MRSFATVPGPRYRFSRSRISGAWCWTSAATGPATRSSSVAPPVRDLTSFTGSERPASASPTISRQRAFRSSGPRPNFSSSSFIATFSPRAAWRGGRGGGRGRRAASMARASCDEGSERRIEAL